MSSHFIDRREAGDQALLVCAAFGATKQSNSAEFSELALSAKVNVVAVVNVWRQTPCAKYLLGTGKVEELTAKVAELEATVVLVDANLSPAQERNLEKALCCRVLDRAGLILDIFAQRARSFEGKLQVELAQLNHLSARLVRGWTHLERQKGGIGLRGPGETQLETDRRLLGQRIKLLTQRLEKVDKQRQLGRRARNKNEIPVVSFVGYTNAGKSTLFNQLTQASVYAADQLFATLDTTLRRIELPNNCPVILADTVGFIRDLPHELISAFKSTLQESVDADLLIHVVDVSDPERQAKIENVHTVLSSIGAEAVQRITVYNKCDCADMPQRIMRNDQSDIEAIYISAIEEKGLALFSEALAEFIQKQYLAGQILLAPEQQKLRAVLYQQATVLGESYDAHGNAIIDIRIAKHLYEKLALQFETSCEAITLTATNAVA